MFKYKQVIREDGVEVITIIHKGVHTFNPTSLVFPYIKECIDADKELYPVEDLISHKIITPCKMELKNHRFTILGEEIDDNLIIEHSDKLELLQHLFLNLKNHDFDKNKTINLFAKYAKLIKPMTDDGMIFLSNINDDLKNTPIFHSNNPEKLIQDYKSLHLGKKINQMLLEKIFKDEHKVNHSPVYLLKEFSSWDENQKRDLLNLNIEYSQERTYKMLFEFYSFYFNTPKAFMNILSKETISSNFLEKFSIVKKLLNPEVKISSIKKLSEYVQKTYEAHKITFEYERLIVKHPIIRNIDGEEVQGMILKCPKNASEVTHWGNRMGNCFGGRATSYQNGDRCLFGLLKDEKLMYVFEINYAKNKTEGVYGDFEGRRRAEPPVELVKELNELFLNKADFKVEYRR